MPSVVIVHAAEDTPPARALAEKLRALGLTPVVDQNGSDAWRAAISAADVVVALWSPRSTANPALVEDARFAQSNAPLVHARMQNAAPPADFANDRSIDLTGWRGEDSFQAWRDLAAAVQERAGVSAQPAAPQPRSASPFAQPAPQPAPRPEPRPAEPRREPEIETLAARPAEAPRAPAYIDVEPEKSGANKLVMIGAVTFIAVAAIAGGGYFAWNNMQGAGASATAWENLDKSDPSALRAFLADEPGGMRDEAQAALAELDGQTFEAAQAADTIESYQGYVSDFPEGEHVLEARGRIAELRAMPQQEEPEIDPLTGMPYMPEDPDLVPPGTEIPGAPIAPPETPPVNTNESGGGPVPLTPRPLPSEEDTPETEPLPTN